ncbi:peptidase S41, partial [Campylobacter upsaliensis]|nr:peptidase S41 [Campylobacter upsaliensis]
MKRKQILAALAGFTGSLILCLGLANVLYADDKTEQMQKRLEALEKLTKTLQ